MGSALAGRQWKIVVFATSPIVNIASLFSGMVRLNFANFSGVRENCNLRELP